MIKKILEGIKDAEVKYISAGHYSIKMESNDGKEADNCLKLIIQNIEKTAKKNGIDFSIAEK